jgi:MarR family transcriptional regulator, lower aerobic nicotinate degradation pathway regulator
MRPADAPCPSARAVSPALAEVAGFLLNQVAAVIRERTAAAIAHEGVHPRQLGLLFLLRDTGTYSQQQLGECLGMDRTTTMQLVNALEAEGLVVRDDDPADRRAYRLRLTARGREVTTRVAAATAEVERQVFAGLKASERQLLKALLRRVLESVVQTG